MPPDPKGGIFAFYERRVIEQMADSDKIEQTVEQTDLIPVVETISADLLTPLSVYLKLSEGAANSFLLESVEGGESLARYSFIGAGPYAVVEGSSNSVLVNGKTIEKPMFDYLREHFAATRAADIPGLPTFIGGAIGYLGFSCAEWFEPTR